MRAEVSRSRYLSMTGRSSLDLTTTSSTSSSRMAVSVSALSVTSPLRERSSRIPKRSPRSLSSSYHSLTWSWCSSSKTSHTWCPSVRDQPLWSRPLLLRLGFA